jgi:antitoxin component YwqK of YwqJK toxin-antitoxin module
MKKILILSLLGIASLHAYKEIKYYPNMEYKSVKIYQKNKLEGLAYKYYDNGNLKSVTNYINDNKEYQYKEYYSNGQIKIVKTYKKNQLIDYIYAYTEEGLLLYESFFDINGNLDSSYLYKNGRKYKLTNEQSKKLNYGINNEQ